MVYEKFIIQRKGSPPDPAGEKEDFFNLSGNLTFLFRWVFHERDIVGIRCNFYQSCQCNDSFFFFCIPVTYP